MKTMIRFTATTSTSAQVKSTTVRRRARQPLRTRRLKRRSFVRIVSASLPITDVPRLSALPRPGVASIGDGGRQYHVSRAHGATTAESSLGPFSQPFAHRFPRAGAVPYPFMEREASDTAAARASTRNGETHATPKPVAAQGHRKRRSKRVELSWRERGWLAFHRRSVETVLLVTLAALLVVAAVVLLVNYIHDLPPPPS